MRASRAWGVVLALGACSSGCGSSDRDAERAEAGALVHAIQAVRRAPHDAKQGLLAALEAAPCTSDRCETKTVCVEAYQRHVRGVEGLAGARRALGGSDALVTRSSTELLTRAQEDLEKSVALAKECADREGELARRYGL